MGGGGILWQEGRAIQYTYFVWDDYSLSILKAKTGDHRGQTAFEFFTLLVCAVTFGKVLTETGACIRGDNLAALNVSNDMASTKPAMNAIARELAWRKIIYKWRYKLQHLPAEQNDEADALSRLTAIPRRGFPQKALESAISVTPPKQDKLLWRTRLDL